MIVACGSVRNRRSFGPEKADDVIGANQTGGSLELHLYDVVDINKLTDICKNYAYYSLNGDSEKALFGSDARIYPTCVT